ncbi:MAG: stage III sporulation protein AE [Eubacterium sp.]|nr:stage III sporulation protein AE [Eubacterium sp.]
MKKGLLLVFLIWLLFGNIVAGEELLTVEDLNFTESSRVLRDNGLKEIDSKEIMKELIEGDVGEVLMELVNLIRKKTIGDVSYVKKLILNLFILLIVSAFFTNFLHVFGNDSVSDTAFYICYISVISVLVTLFDFVSGMAGEFLRVSVNYISAVIPVYFVTVSITGQASALGFYQVILVVIGIIQFLFLHVFLPLVKIYLALGLVNNLSKEDLLSKMCGLLKKIIVKGNRFLIGLVTGIHLLQAMILPALDESKNTLTYKIMNSIPGVGSGIDSYTGIVFGSVRLIKNTMGGTIMIVIVLICGIPFVKMKLYHFSIQLLAASMQPVADQRMISGIQIAGDSIEMIASMIAGVSILFLVSIVIICISTNMIR